MRVVGTLVTVWAVLLGGAEVVVAQEKGVLNQIDPASIQKVVNEICSDGGLWLRCYSLDPARCRSVTTEFVSPCAERGGADSSEDGEDNPLMDLLGCFNEEFMSKYGAGELKTPECANPMKHLMEPAQ